MGVKVSYCTTCHGRLWQLALTVFDNLARLQADEEMVLVDYGSPDGLNRFVETSSACRDAISEGRLVYVQTEAKHFHASRAKNLAHRFGRGAFLVNLDADNHNLGMRKRIEETFQGPSEKKILQMHRPKSWVTHDGSFGRICLPRTWFYALGGYDESFLPMGAQDTDLVRRGIAFGLEHIIRPIPTVPVANTRAEKAQHCKNKNWNYMAGVNHRTMKAKLANGHLIANPEGWGAAEVRVNLKTDISLNPIISPA